MSAATASIGLAGEYRLRVDAQRAELEHSYALTEADLTATPATAAEPVAAAAAAAAPSADKPQRLTANTFATQPSDIPRSCPVDSTLANLAALLHRAKAESDRYLTQVMAEVDASAGGAGLNNQTSGTKRKAAANNDDEDEEADDDDTDKKAKREENAQ